MNVIENYIRRRARLYSYVWQVGCGKLAKNCCKLKWTLVLFFILLALTWLYLSAYVICGVGFDAMVGPHFDNCPHIDSVPRLLHYHQLVPKADWNSHSYLDTWTDLQHVAALYYFFDNAVGENELQHVRLPANAFTSPAKGKLLAHIKILNGTQYVLARRPRLTQVWGNLSRNERSHFLRYLNMEADGGIYADPNVRLRVMVEDWLRRYQLHEEVRDGERLAAEEAAKTKNKQDDASASQQQQRAIPGENVLMRGAEVPASEARVLGENYSPSDSHGGATTQDQATVRLNNAEKPFEILRTDLPTSLTTTPMPTIVPTDHVHVPEASAAPVAPEVAPPLVPTDEPTDLVGSMDFILGFAQDTAYEYPCPDESGLSAAPPSDAANKTAAIATCRLPFLLCISTFAGRQGSRLFSHVREAVEEHILKNPQRSQSYADESLKTGEVIFTQIVLDEIARRVYDKPRGKTADGLPIALGDNLLAIHRRGLRLSLRYGDGLIVRGVILPRRAFADPGRMEKDYLVLKMRGSTTEPPYISSLFSSY